MSRLTKYLRVTADHSDEVGEGVEDVETLTEFLDEVAEKIPISLRRRHLQDRVPDVLFDAVQTSAPWLTAAADVVGEVVPLVKVCLNLGKFLTRETDPNVLGLFAVSFSYQAALSDATKRIVADPDLRKRIGRPNKLRGALRGTREPEKPVVEEFAGFRLESALSHPLILRADEAIVALATSAGYPEDLRRIVLEDVHTHMVEKFRALISDGRTLEKTPPSGDITVQPVPDYLLDSAPAGQFFPASVDGSRPATFAFRGVPARFHRAWRRV